MRTVKDKSVVLGFFGAIHWLIFDLSVPRLSILEFSKALQNPVDSIPAPTSTAFHQTALASTSTPIKVQ